ncbi:MAG: DUF3276 family protein [Bacteroidales bacterium]|nr:DUF3276 family protein [Bacteroidales bacterium]
MGEELFNSGRSGKYASEDIFNWTIRAGKRTYFLDAKNSGRNGLYLSITESKKRVNDEGRSFYEKHKIFLYQQDFKNFLEGLHKVVAYIEKYKKIPRQAETDYNHEDSKKYTQVEFDDLESTEANGLSRTEK